MTKNNNNLAVKKKSALNIEISFGKVNMTQKAVFAKHLSVMLKAGLTIEESLRVISTSSKGKLKKVVKKVLKSVQAGQPLAESFARFPKIFDEFFVSATYAGESSGTLEENFERLANQMEKEAELAQKIKGAMIYPTFILIATFLLGMAMTFLVLPKIIPLFEGLRVDLPFTTRALIAFSHFVEAHSSILFFGVTGAVIFLIWLFRRNFMKPFNSFLILKTPIIKSISKNSNLARFCRSMATMLKSGLNIDESIEIASKTMSNFYYKRSLKKISKRISSGTKISENLKLYSHLYPEMVISMIRVGEESGRLEETLYYLADFYDLEVDTATKSLTTAIEPMLLIVIGLAVGFLAMSIITPIYSITGEIKS